MTDTDLRPVDLSPGDAPGVLALYEGYGWWEDRTVEDVERAIDHSLAVGLRADDTGELVASARVVTDCVYYAWVHDVIVAADRRGDALGERLMAAVVGHPDLADVTPTLMCRDGLLGFYERCGFERYPGAVEVPGEGREALYTLVYRRRGE